MGLDPIELRRVMGHFATGVTVVTAAEAGTGRPYGLTANAVASVSLEPPLVLACVEVGSDTHPHIRRAGAFAISILAAGQETLARRFAAQEVAEKFSGVGYRREVTGAPVLEDALAWVDCRLWAEYLGGDHTIFVGEVLAGDARDGAPLIFYRGGYGRYRP
jgi:flavin reductase (DIM6/NTAB) family NADH-FMN oxidoreductase RutF